MVAPFNFLLHLGYLVLIRMGVVKSAFLATYNLDPKDYKATVTSVGIRWDRKLK